jgi:hypothetical protein
MTSVSRLRTVAVSKWVAINEDRKRIKTCVFRVLITKIPVQFITLISRNSASENAYKIILLHSDGRPLPAIHVQIVIWKVTKPENTRRPFGQSILRLFVLTSLANLHFLICTLSCSN